MKDCLICGGNTLTNLSFSTLFKTNNQLMCRECSEKLERVNRGCIMCCKKTNEEICQDCLYWLKEFEIKNHSLYYYNEFARSIINKIKFNGDCRILNAFKLDINKYFIKRFPVGKYNVVIVPIHKERLIERGFNQSLYIAKMLPYKILDIFIKTKNEKQSKKKKEERIKSGDLFQIKTNIDLMDKNLIIVDDIYTTGATIHSIGKLLYEKRANLVTSFTLFRS